MKFAQVTCAGALHGAVPYPKGLRPSDWSVVAYVAVLSLLTFNVGILLALGLN